MGTEHGTISILAPALKGVFNRWGDELYPGALPVRLGDGRKLPEPLLPYTYEIRVVSQPASAIGPLLPQSDRSGRDRVVLVNGAPAGLVGSGSWIVRDMSGGLDLLPVDGAAPSPITRRVWPR